jgi:hypothetical protein
VFPSGTPKFTKFRPAGRRKSRPSPGAPRMPAGALPGPPHPRGRRGVAPWGHPGLPCHPRRSPGAAGPVAAPRRPTLPPGRRAVALLGPPRRVAARPRDGRGPLSGSRAAPALLRQHDAVRECPPALRSEARRLAQCRGPSARLQSVAPPRHRHVLRPTSRNPGATRFPAGRHWDSQVTRFYEPPSTGRNFQK